jgi:hypothetical protein
MKLFPLIQIILFVTFVSCVSVNGAEQKTSPFVAPPVILHAKDVLPPKIIRGNNYVVKDRVQNDGMINTYELSTLYGPLTVESTEQLMSRIQELNAIQVMEAMDRGKIFDDALVAGVKAPVKGAINLVKAPVDTTKGAIEGAGRFLTNIGRSIMSDDPHQDNAFKVAVGYDAVKRGFAYEFGINPYSNYEPAMSKLGEVAQASVAGGLAPRAAMAVIDSSVVTALKVTGATEGLRKLIRDNPPGELEKINRAKLAGIGIDPSLVDTLMNNYAYDPQGKTLLVGAIEQLKDVQNRATFIAAAGLVTRQSVARFYRETAQLMAGYHTKIAPVVSLGRIGNIPFLKRADGTVLLVLPLDYIFKTESVANKLHVIDEGLKKTGNVFAKELWLTGKVNNGSREMLETSGWKITEEIGEKLLK